MAQSDKLVKPDGDKFNLSSIQAQIECDLVLRVTTHPFNSFEYEDTMDYDRGNLKLLREQEGSKPEYTFPGRREVKINDNIQTSNKRPSYMDGYSSEVLQSVTSLPILPPQGSP